MNSILLLEDDYKLAAEVKLHLEGKQLKCDVVYDGLLFFKQLKFETYDLFILDQNVPHMNGLEVCKKIRTEDVQTPILMLTAYSDLEDKVEALQAGADDYLVKPFHFEELLARIQALLRRSANNGFKKATYTIADLEIDTDEQMVTRAGKSIVLTPKEYKLLEVLAAANGKTLSKQTLTEKVWDINFETGTNTIEVYISILRTKIDKPFGSPLIHTRTGYGYYLKEL
ncbi:MAG: response regulator transcription factor [Chitinophagaceae bacterium]|nr:response regulator transcription factor [Chitinophagaceae bacterium]